MEEYDRDGDGIKRGKHMADTILNLQLLLNKFEAVAIKDLMDAKRMDGPMLSAMTDQFGVSIEDRYKAVNRWLFDYKVHRVKVLQAGILSKTIIAFADAKPKRLDPDPISGNYRALIEQFVALYAKLSSAVEKRKDGTLRDVTSLTSKVLWSCYPTSVPIFDSQACRALQVISVLLGIEKTDQRILESTARRYLSFVADWFHIYRISGLNIRNDIDNEYKVRVLDIILWRLGADRYTNSTRKLSNDEG
jgi:hypothetical protein